MGCSSPEGRRTHLVSLLHDAVNDRVFAGLRLTVSQQEPMNPASVAGTEAEPSNLTRGRRGVKEFLRHFCMQAGPVEGIVKMLKIL
jgi:hypothetical protein